MEEVSMRKVHFKGIYEYQWVFGDLVRKNGSIYIGDIGQKVYEVAPETVSECTCMTDFTPWSEVPMEEKENLVSNYNETALEKHTIESFEKVWEGIPIYENDILECHHLVDESMSFAGPVVFHNGCFGVAFETNDGNRFLNFNDLIEYSYFVRGSIFQIKDPPEGYQPS